MRNRSVSIGALLLVLAGCGGGGGESRTSATSEGADPTIPQIPGKRSSVGAQVAVRSGCLACHRLGEAGNDGPGPSLTQVGARMPASAIARTLVDPTPPMPSYEDLPRAERAALVKYLASLR